MGSGSVCPRAAEGGTESARDSAVGSSLGRESGSLKGGRAALRGKQMHVYLLRTRCRPPWGRWDPAPEKRDGGCRPPEVADQGPSGPRGREQEARAVVPRPWGPGALDTPGRAVGLLPQSHAECLPTPRVRTHCGVPGPG